MHGRDEVRAYFKGYVAAFPDGRNELVNAVEAPDKIAIEVKFIGTNTGQWATRRRPGNGWSGPS